MVLVAGPALRTEWVGWRVRSLVGLAVPGGLAALLLLVLAVLQGLCVGVVARVVLPVGAVVVGRAVLPLRVVMPEPLVLPLRAPPVAGLAVLPLRLELPLRVETKSRVALLLEAALAGTHAGE